jgi:hypothetical protein
VITVVEDQDHPAGEVGVGQTGTGHQQMPGQALGRRHAAVRLERAERIHRHSTMMAQPERRVAPVVRVGEAVTMAVVTVESVGDHVRVSTPEDTAGPNPSTASLSKRPPAVTV